MILYNRLAMSVTITSVATFALVRLCLCAMSVIRGRESLHLRGTEYHLEVGCLGEHTNCLEEHTNCLEEEHKEEPRRI